MRCVSVTESRLPTVANVVRPTLVIAEGFELLFYNVVGNGVGALIVDIDDRFRMIRLGVGRRRASPGDAFELRVGQPG